jgi:hypothetical protein
MPKLQRLVKDNWSTRIKDPSVGLLRPLVGSHSPAPKLRWYSVVEKGPGVDQLT